MDQITLPGEEAIHDGAQKENTMMLRMVRRLGERQGIEPEEFGEEVRSLFDKPNSTVSWTISIGVCQTADNSTVDTESSEN